MHCSCRVADLARPSSIGCGEGTHIVSCCPRAEYNGLNIVAVHFLAPLYGVPSGLYTLHHRVMHHAVQSHPILLSKPYCEFISSRNPGVCVITP